MIAHTGSLHRFLFPSFVWRMNSPDIFLTFDDGPHPTATPEVLKVLNTARIKGTFFLTGSNAVRYSSLVTELGTEGHCVGVHAFNHSRALAFSRAATRNEILRTEEVISSAGVNPVKIFRPPFGAFTWNTVSAARSLQYRIIMWTTLTGDFRPSWSDEKITSTALSKLSAGAILVFHDNESTKSRIAGVLTDTIARIKDHGFNFQAIE